MDAAHVSPADEAPAAAALRREAHSAPRRRPWSLMLKVGLSAALLLALYTAADWSAVAQAVAGLHAAPLGVALALFVPQTAVSAWRWRLLGGRVVRLGYGTALRHTLQASAWNLVLPSKLGEVAKVAFLQATWQQRRRLGAAVLLERLSDVAALAVWWGAGWLGSRGLPAAGVAAAAVVGLGIAWRGWRRTAPWLALAGSALLLWALHLWQVELFLRCAGVHVSPWVALQRLPAAIFAGLVPITLWGVGTRDAALVLLFADVASRATMTAVGMLTALRYLVPGAAGALLMLTGGMFRAPRPCAALRRGA
jgi:hypothetical protein